MGKDKIWCKMNLRLSWHNFLTVLLSCANQFKVNYLRFFAWNLYFCTESYAGAAYCSGSLLKILLLKKTTIWKWITVIIEKTYCSQLNSIHRTVTYLKKICLFQVLCQSVTYTTFPTPKKIHKSVQRPLKYKFNREKLLACFVFQLKLFVILMLISLHNRKLSCRNAVLAVH